VLIASGLLISLSVCGCEKKEEAPTESAEPAVGPQTAVTSQKEKEQEASMAVNLQWLGHASFRIEHGGTVIYIDPWKIKGSPHDATTVLVSHSHTDHYSSEDIAKVSGTNTKLLGPGDVIADEGNGETTLPGQKVELPGVNVMGVPAYNLNKRFHPQSQKWLGFVVEIGGKRIYYAGDTDATVEMKKLTKIDVAILPVGGTYTMNAAEAAQAVNEMKPRLAIPCHWGDIVGGRADAEKFAQLTECEVKVLSPGETISVP
jgi:L-ascorbate metabolism protein UlaG (beta-lactamase superfamily)